MLASSSPYRRQLLARLKVAFVCQAAAIDECPRPHETPTALVERLSLEKARAVAPQFAAKLVIGSDQVAIVADEILGKPGTAARAREQLSRASGSSVRFFTGLCVLDSASGRHDVATVTCNVRFRRLSKAQISTYVALEQPLDCAGSFKAEGLGIALFERLDSPDPTAIAGLPLITLVSMLAARGFDVFDHLPQVVA